MLTVNNVYKCFAGHHVLTKVSFSMNSKEIIGLAGPSGSGKSTLLRCIQKLETIDSGSIHCQAETGFMFQDFQLFPHMRVLKNLTYASSIQPEYNYIKTKTYALELLAKLGISNKSQAYPSELSGGQKQRVALARSLMMQPALLLCDEPTSGLDVATIAEVISLLQSVQAMGITMLIASHDLDFLVQIADRILLLKAGQVIVDICPKQTNDPIQDLKTYY